MSECGPVPIGRQSRILTKTGKAWKATAPVSIPQPAPLFFSYPALSQNFVEARFGGLPEGFKEFALSEKPMPPELV
jgi:hypothetical protein